MILNQARVHDFYLETMRNSPDGSCPTTGAGSPSSPSTPDEPRGRTRSRSRLERIDPGREGDIETMRARYVVGCDGARSAVRRSIGAELRGDCRQQAWGVDGRAGGHRLPRHPTQGRDPVGEQGQPAGHPARRRLPGAHLHRTRTSSSRANGPGTVTSRRTI